MDAEQRGAKAAAEREEEQAAAEATEEEVGKHLLLRLPLRRHCCRGSTS